MENAIFVKEVHQQPFKDRATNHLKEDSPKDLATSKVDSFRPKALPLTEIQSDLIENTIAKSPQSIPLLCSNLAPSLPISAFNESEEAKSSLSLSSSPLVSPCYASPLLRQLQTPSLNLSSPSLSLKGFPDCIPCTTPTSIHSPSSSSLSPTIGINPSLPPPLFDSLDTHASLRGHVKQQLLDDLKPLKQQFDSEFLNLFESWCQLWVFSNLKDKLEPTSSTTTSSSSNANTVLERDMIETSNQFDMSGFFLHYPLPPTDLQASLDFVPKFLSPEQSRLVSYIHRMGRTLLKVDAALLSVTNFGLQAILMIQHLVSRLQLISIPFTDETQALLNKNIYLWSPIARVCEVLQGFAPDLPLADTSLPLVSPLLSRGRSISIQHSDRFSDSSRSRSRSRPNRISSPSSHSSSDTSCTHTTFQSSSDILLSTSPSILPSSSSPLSISFNPPDTVQSSVEIPSPVPISSQPGPTHTNASPLSSASLPPTPPITSTPNPSPTPPSSSSEPSPNPDVLKPSANFPSSNVTSTLDTTKSLNVSSPSLPLLSLATEDKSYILDPSSNKSSRKLRTRSIHFFSLFKSIKAAFKGHSAPSLATIPSSSSISSTTSSNSTPSSACQSNSSFSSRRSLPLSSSSSSGLSFHSTNEKEPRKDNSQCKPDKRKSNVTALSLSNPSSSTSNSPATTSHHPWSSKRPLSASLTFLPTSSLRPSSSSSSSSSSSNSSSSSSISSQDGKTKLVCRLCEESIDASFFETHVKGCKVTQELEMKLYQVDMKLRALVRKVHKHREALEAASLQPQGSRHSREGSMDFSMYKKYDALTRYLHKVIALVDHKRDVHYKEKKYRRKLLHKVHTYDSLSPFTDWVKQAFTLTQEKMNYIDHYQQAWLSYQDELASKKPVSLFQAILFGGGFIDHSSSHRHRKKSLYLPKISDFEFLKPISKGAFGRVYLARKKATGDVFAIKMLKKDDMVRKNMVHHVLAERQVLSLAKTPYVVNLYFAFQSPRHLFLVMDYLVGGDLSSLLAVIGPFSTSMALHYFAEMTLALEYLHSLGIIHRDIKPDNVLIDSKGHLKLTDFGLSRIIVRDQEIRMQSSEHVPYTVLNRKSLQRSTLEIGPSKMLGTRPFLGTPDYLAPELLLGVGHDARVDWWALGVCLFEFLTSYPPFTDDTPEFIFRNILANKIDWPDPLDIHEDAVSLIKQLLNPEPQNRAKAEYIKTHPFTKSLDWAHIRELEAPFVPNPDDAFDTSYFHARNEAQQIDLQEVDREIPVTFERTSPLASAKQEDDQTFENFIFKNVAGLENLNESFH